MSSRPASCAFDRVLGVSCHRLAREVLLNVLQEIEGGWIAIVLFQGHRTAADGLQGTSSIQLHRATCWCLRESWRRDVADRDLSHFVGHVAIANGRAASQHVVKSG